MSAVWVPIPGLGGEYEASSLGKVRSKDRVVTQRGRWGGYISYLKPGRILKPWTGNSGYETVYICADGKRVAVNVHRLVAHAFHGEPDGKVVNHKNGDKTDNRPENLEWCTYEHNVAHAMDTGLLNIETAIIATPKGGGDPITFRSTQDAARTLGKGRRNIWSALNGKVPSAYGFFWKLAA